MSRLAKKYTEDGHCHTWGGTNWFACRAHFVKDIKELEKALNTIEKVTDLPGVNMHKLVPWIGSLARAVVVGDMKTVRALYDEIKRP